MNLRQLEFFKKLADTEHMTQAATLLNTTQPNLSHSMSELEKELGAPLFEKAGRNIRLTKYGKLFYSYVNHALNELSNGQRALTEIISPEQGQIDFGFIYTMGSTIAPSITQQFLAAEGNQQVTFNFFQGNSQSIIQLLKEEKIDIALSSRIGQEEDIHYLPFVQQEMVLVVPQSHPLAIHDSISLKETTEFPYVYFSKNSGLRTYIDSLTANSGLTPKIACEVEEDHTMLGFVGCNFGIAIMPDIPSISAYPVKKIAISDSRPPRYIYLATRKNGFMSPAVKRFYEFCLQHIKS